MAPLTRVVAIVQARTGSSRFPGKVLADLHGRPMLLRMLERVDRATSLDEVVVATTVEAGDDEVAQLVSGAGYRVTRGSEEDVLDRFVSAAREADAEVVVRLTGDCPLIDPALIDRCVSSFLDGGADFVSNALSESYPDGMDAEVFSRELLERAGGEATLPSEREHVTFFMWKTGRFEVRSLTADEPHGDLRLTVDHPEDLEVVRSIYATLYDRDPAFGLDEILRVAATLEMPNRHIARNSGWGSALERDRDAGAG